MSATPTATDVEPAVEFRERFATLIGNAPPDAQAIYADDRWWHWRDVARVTRQLDAALTDAGLAAGTRVGIVLENRPEHLIAVLAILATDRCVTTLSPLQPAQRLVADIERSDLPAVLVSPTVAARVGVTEAIERAGLAVLLAPDGTIAAGDTAVTSADTVRVGVAIEMLTSGTTGPPKRIRLTDGQLQASLRSASIPARSDDGRPAMSDATHVVAAPLVHIGGLWNCMSTLYAARRLALMERFRVEDWVDLVERCRPKAAGLVPAAIRAVLEADVPRERLSSLMVLLSGTAPCPTDLADAFTEKYGIAILMTYGATEFAGAVAGWTYPLHQQWWATKKGSTGRAFPGVELRVVDDDGVETMTDLPGRLEVRTAQASAGTDRWTRTSDLARVDADRFVWIEGRSDDAIIRGGFKIAPATVKRVLEAHPSVAEAGVAGLPDARLGAVPVAAVELAAGASAPTPDELIALCREHLAPYEVPVDVRIVDELPRTPSLKISRVDLLELFADPSPAT